MIKIKTFRAVNDVESCRKFSEGHRNVLTSYNIPKITSNNEDWFYNPDIYVIMVESNESGEALGGAKICIANDKYPLPVQEAIGKIDPKINQLVSNYAKSKTGEICGLWNAKTIAGKGLSVMLIRSGIAKAGVTIANQLKLGSLFALAAPWTLEMVKKMGFIIETSIGNKGTFSYPKPDLLATLLILKDTEKLKDATINERESILDLREKPKQIKVEVTPNGSLLEIEYDLIISNIEKPIVFENKYELLSQA